MSFAIMSNIPDVGFGATCTGDKLVLNDTANGLMISKFLEHVAPL